MTLSFVTSSSGKFSEAKLVLPDLKQLNIDLPEIQELDAEVIIAAKLDAVLEQNHRPVVVEDTGLYCQGLNGFPGPLVKWMLQALGCEQLAQQVIASGNIRAEARTILGLLSENGEKKYFTGTTQGTIVLPRGTGFGWDPIFQPVGSELTFGEMTVEQKQQFSMRAKAFDQLIESL